MRVQPGGEFKKVAPPGLNDFTKIMTINENGYNKLQINESTEWINGSVVRRNILLNVRSDDIEEITRLYQQLKEKIDVEKVNVDIKSKTANIEKQNEKEQIKSKDVCPECGSPLIEKSGISSKTGKPYNFVGCSAFPQCNYIKNSYPNSRNRKTKEKIPAENEEIPVVDL